MEDNKSMKKRWLILISFIIAVMIMITLSIFAGKRPYKDLQTSDIVCASVHLAPPDKTVEIIDIEELVQFLKILSSIVKIILILNTQDKKLVLHL